MNKKYNEPCVSLNLYIPQSRKEEIRELVRGALSGDDGWVSVEDRLPEEWDNYLVSFKKTTGELTYHPYHKWCWIGEDGYVMEYNLSVTHWMPLPQPPKSK